MACANSPAQVTASLAPEPSHAPLASWPAVQVVQSVQHAAASLPGVLAPLLNVFPLQVKASHVATQVASASVVVLPVKPELQEHSYPVPGAATSAQVAPVPQSMPLQPSVSVYRDRGPQLCSKHRGCALFGGCDSSDIRCMHVTLSLHTIVYVQSSPVQVAAPFVVAVPV